MIAKNMMSKYEHMTSKYELGNMKSIQTYQKREVKYGINRKK